MESIKKFLGFRNHEVIPQIAVVGDGMVDEYYQVKANRISPEFPIPVMLSQEKEPDIAKPGGAANVVAQFSPFNVNASYYGFVDDDALQVFINNGIKTIYADIQHHRLPRKCRFYDGSFPLCRWDIEQKNYGLSLESIKQKQKQIRLDIITKNLDVVVYSDYGKGFFETSGWSHRWSSLANDALTIVDPKGPPLDKWIGCDIFKPNANEAEALSGKKEWKDQCEYFQDFLECETVIITQGGDGVAVKHETEYFEYRPGLDIDPNSVIGAGDCFVAILALALAYGMNVKEAVEVAYTAGAIYVQKKHNKPVTVNDLQCHIDPVGGKIIHSISDLPPRDYKLVFTNGCFDMLHAGHVDLLYEASLFGDKLLVGINSDESVRALKGDGRPIVPLEERMRLLASLECVDWVMPFDDADVYDTVALVSPDVLVKGGDYKVSDMPSAKLVDDVRIVKFKYDVSTTTRLAKITRL